jgi:hypothetical protein
LIVKSEVRRPNGRSRSRQKENIKIYVTKMHGELKGSNVESKGGIL